MDEYGGTKGSSGTVFILLGMVGALAVVGGVIYLLASELGGQSAAERALAQAGLLEATGPASVPAEAPVAVDDAAPVDVPVETPAEAPVPAEAALPEAFEPSPKALDTSSGWSVNLKTRTVRSGDGRVQEFKSVEEMIAALAGDDPEKLIRYKRLFGVMEKGTKIPLVDGQPAQTEMPERMAKTKPDPETLQRSDRKQTAVRRCKEDDGGGKIYRAGRAWGRYKNGRRFNLRDRCQDGRHIVEYWCERRTLVEARFDCLDPRFASYRFTGCRKGACVRARR